MNKFEINLNLYRSFYYVAKYGGFTKGSEFAAISQSSLSSNIKKLEYLLDIKLFERKASNVTLTREGKKLFFKLEEIINVLNDQIEYKEINIGCIRFIADNYLDKVILEFKKKYKDIKINFFFANTTELYQMLKKDELDLIISRYPLFYKFENYIIVEKITDVDNVFVCSKDFYEDKKSELVNDNYLFPLILPNSSEKRRTIEQYLIDNNIKYNVEIEIPNSNLLKKLILDSIGIGYINKEFVKEEINNNKIVVLSNFKNVPLDNISIIHNSKKNNPIVNSFISEIKTIIGKSNNNYL